MYKFFSLKISLIFVSLYALAIAIATFIQRDASSSLAKELVYDTTWFWFLQFFLAFLLLVNIFKSKMYTLKKIPLFIFHISFLFILFGAFLSNNYGYDSDLYLTKNISRSTMLSGDYYMDITLTKDGKSTSYSKQGENNIFDNEFLIDGKKLKIKNIFYLPKAKLEVQRVRTSKGMQTGAMSFEIIKNKQQREKYYVQDKAKMEFDGFDLYFNMEPLDVEKPYIKIEANEKKSQHFKSNLLISSNFGEKYDTTSIHDFSQGILYNITDKLSILAGEATTIGKIIAIKADVNDTKTDSVMMSLIEYDGEKYERVLIEKEKYFSGYTTTLWINASTKIFIHWGKRVRVLPFEVYLDDFKVEHYPGSSYVKNYFSHINIKDKGKDIQADISINNPFTYQGFRFFQTKFENQKSTILRVNYAPGTFYIYLGYILLSFGLLMNLFRKRGF